MNLDIEMLDAICRMQWIKRYLETAGYIPEKARLEFFLGAKVNETYGPKRRNKHFGLKSEENSNHLLEIKYSSL